MPSPLIVRTVSKMRRTSTGASPSVGSSSMSTRGRLMSARPMAHICCSPDVVHHYSQQLNQASLMMAPLRGPSDVISYHW